ncbi:MULTISPECIES: hypothetical protein [Microbacterium]|nr:MULTISPECIES: hypothetical protein [Microbacterium]MCK6066520.1 hypothetical protein [Microbacterium sp. EYE_512]
MAQIVADSSEPMAILQTEDLAALLGGAGRNEAAETFRTGLLHAQREKLPLIVDDPQVAGSPNGPLEAFKAAGFSTRVVLAVERDSTSALTASTRQLRSGALGAHSTLTQSVAEQWDPIMETLRGIPTTTLDRVTVLDGDGAPMYDGPPSGKAWAAARDARHAPLSGMQGIAWLSELRRIGEYVRSARQSISRDDVALVEQLYAVAQKRVLPELPIRPDSTAATVQRDRIRVERAQLKRLILDLDRDRDAPGTARPNGPDVTL